MAEEISIKNTEDLHSGGVTVEEFLDFIQRRENEGRDFELINGEIVPMVSHPKSSKLAFRIGTYLGMYLLQNDIGHAMTADGGYVIGESRVQPDVSFISYEKQPDELPSEAGFVTNTPDFVVEVISPSDREKRILTKVGIYLEAGALVWLVYPEAKQIVVYAPGQPPQVFTEADTLEGGEVLPGFTVPVKDIFA